MSEREILIRLEDARLAGSLTLPADAHGLILFAHGSGSSRHSPRNQFVAEILRKAGLGTLLFDLLTVDEERTDRRTAHLRFDIRLLSRRLIGATRWFSEIGAGDAKKLGYFGSSTGAAAALVAAAELGNLISVVVSRGGRPDLAKGELARVTAPTLLIVGGEDEVVLGLNRNALESLRCEKALKIVPGAGHLFEEPGALEAVGKMAADWFVEHLQPDRK